MERRFYVAPLTIAVPGHFRQPDGSLSRGCGTHYH
jgi:hypothetical protein